jgi:hypothetical protein
MTPEESWSGTKPDIANLRVFGCPGYVLIPKELRVGKLAHKTRQCVFIGYSLTRKAWRFWNPVKHSVIESRDVVFDKCAQCCSHPVSPVDLSSLKCTGDKGVTATDASPVTDADIPISHPIVDPHLTVPLVGPLPPVDPLPAPPMRRRRLNEIEHLFDYFEHHPLCDEGGGARIEGDIVDEELEQGLQASMLVLEHGLPDDTVEDVGVLAATTGQDISIAPSSLHEALQGSDATEWTEVIRQEIDSLMHTNTFVKVDQVPTPFTPIGSKFIFSLKRDVSGKVI